MRNEWRSIFNSYQLSPRSLSRLEQSLVLIKVPAGQILQLEGEECRGIYWVLSGEMSAYRIAMDGRELTLQYFNAGDILNLVSAFETPPVTIASIRAAQDSQCLWLDLTDLSLLLAECSDLSTALLKLLAKRLHHMADLVEQIGLHSVRGRLAQFLVDLGDGKLPPRQYTQNEMAAHIGTVRDMVGRTLKSFETAGLIERQRSHIVLLDRTGLEKEANA